MTKSKLLAVASVLVATICHGQSTTQAKYMSRAAIERNNSLASITADHPATLFTVISTIREEYGWQIDWEAAPGYSRFDVVDATGPKWRAAHPYAKGVTRPNGGRFTSTFHEPEDISALSAKTEVLSKVLGDYNASDNPGKYVLRTVSDGQVAVIGTQVRDNGGAWESVTPLLDTPITIPSEQRSVYETVRAILAALTVRTGKRVIIMSVPNNLFRGTQVTTGGDNVPARQLLLQALASTQRPLQYDLGYDPDVPVYILNISVAARAVDDGLGGKKRVAIDRPH